MSNPQIKVFHLHDKTVPFEPARKGRVWMDESPNRFAYRCLPLAIANSAGWEMFCPSGFYATWDGGAYKDSIKLQFDDPELNAPAAHAFALSHFGSGVLTFHSGLLLRTPEGVQVWCKGSPNEIKHGIQALEGVIETPWLPFPFTMNWRFTQPGTVRFNAGDPFGFLTLTRLNDLTSIVPTEHDIRDDPEAFAAYQAWSTSRRDFTEKLRAGDPATVEQGWQRNYTQGTHPEGTQAPLPAEHHTKVRTKKPRKKAPADV